MSAAADHALYVYGIVPEDVDLAPGAEGVGDPPGRVRLVRHGDIAAMVSDISPDEPLRHRRDLRMHRDLLDAASAEVPVLPVRFGSIVADEEALTGELLSPCHDEFAAALRELDGHAEYLIAVPGDDVISKVADLAARYATATRVRADEVAALVPEADTAGLERALAELSGDVGGGADLRMRGPVAPYDFVADLTAG